MTWPECSHCASDLCDECYYEKECKQCHKTFCIDCIQTGAHKCKEGEEKTDPIVEQVVEEYRKRSAFGMKKYGHNLARTDLDTLQWLQHTQEELMDAVLYLQRLKQDLKALLKRVEEEKKEE
jgi:hypothetical protein